MNPSSNIIGYRRNGCPIRLIRGASPEGDPAPEANPKGTPATDQGSTESGNDGTQTEDWKDRFEGQQKVNRDLEGKFNELRNGLAAALGVQGKKASTDDLVASLTQQVTAMQRDTLVYRVAVEHQITDAEDLELIKASTDEQAMRKLAARLAAKPSAPAGGDVDKNRGPKPDPSQGLSGGTGAKPASSVTAIREERIAAAAARKRTA